MHMTLGGGGWSGLVVLNWAEGVIPFPGVEGVWLQGHFGDFAGEGRGYGVERLGLKRPIHFLADREPPRVWHTCRYKETGTAIRPTMQRPLRSAVAHHTVSREGWGQEDNHAWTRGWAGVQWASTPCTLRLSRW